MALIAGMIGGMIGAAICTASALAIGRHVVVRGKAEIKSRRAAESNKTRAEKLDKFWQRADRARLMKPKPVQDKDQRS